MSECNHEKVYAPFYFLSNPPKTPWVCRKCGEQGKDAKITVDLNEYNKLVSKYPKGDKWQSNANA